MVEVLWLEGVYRSKRPRRSSGQEGQRSQQRPKFQWMSGENISSRLQPPEGAGDVTVTHTDFLMSPTNLLEAEGSSDWV